jgi:hypothetical protein
MIFNGICGIYTGTQSKYAAFGQMFGQALSLFGWLPQTGHGEIANNGLTGTSYAWSGTPNINATVVAPCASYTFKGAWVSGTTYVGIGGTLNSTLVDVVTSGGLTYVHLTASSSSATAPASDTTNWAPFNFEIWKTNDSLSSTLPIYLKLAYVQSVTTNTPSLLVQVGTGVDGNGNITGATIMWNTAPNTFIRVNPTTAIDGAQYNNAFSGDSGNFRFCIFKDKGQAALTQQACQIFIIDRSCSSQTATNRTDTFVYVCHDFAGQNQFWSSIIPNPSFGITGSSQVDTTRWMGTVVYTNSIVGVGGGQTPMPTFPLFTQNPNPQLGMCCFFKAETQDGCIIPVWMYGNPHLYLVCAGTSITGGPNGANATVYPAILWE